MLVRDNSEDRCWPPRQQPLRHRTYEQQVVNDDDVQCIQTASLFLAEWKQQPTYRCKEGSLTTVARIPLGRMIWSYLFLSKCGVSRSFLNSKGGRGWVEVIIAPQGRWWWGSKRRLCMQLSVDCGRRRRKIKWPAQQLEFYRIIIFKTILNFSTCYFLASYSSIMLLIQYIL